MAARRETCIISIQMSLRAQRSSLYRMTNPFRKILWCVTEHRITQLMALCNDKVYGGFALHEMEKMLCSAPVGFHVPLKAAHEGKRRQIDVLGTFIATICMDC